MRVVIALSTLVAAALVTATAPVSAQNGRWCLRGSDSGALNCGFDTLAQCQASRPGASITSSCSRNPRAARAQARRPRNN
jgi:hypothetical protein